MKNNKKLLSLEDAFNSTFHHSLIFDDFINIDVKDESTSFYIGKNLILSPSDKLKKYLKFLNNFVFDYADVNAGVVHSYRQGKSAYTAVFKHANSKYFFKTDIHNFFNSISIQDVENILNNNLSNVPIDDISKYKSQLLNIVTINNSLPVGFSTSPNISNTSLYFFDNALETYCLEKEIIYTRYSDDIILSSTNKNNLNEIQRIVSDILNLHFSDRVHLNPHKTKYTHKGNKIKLLGMVILPSGVVSVDNKIKKQLEVLLHFYINDKEKFYDYLEKHYNGNPLKISGQLSYINTIDKSYLNKLRKKYGNFIIDTFFHRAVK